jgi:hypothetical protein
MKVGPPFRTRLRNGAGLSFPPIPILPNFICEACTVRSVLDRELHYSGNDLALLGLERMRLIDMSHNWSAGAHKVYQGGLRVIQDFEASFGLQILRPTMLDRPPDSESIPLMWTQQQYALRPGRSRGTETNTAAIVFTTTRALRSAANQFYSWDLQVAHPEEAMKDASARAVHSAGCLPTDSLGYVFMSKGMSQRMGDEAKPSVALLHRHVEWMDTFFDNAYHNSRDQDERAELARAALANLVAWLGWLRATEIFSLQWSDVTVVDPEDGPSLDLPADVGAVGLKLLPQTKASRTRTADVLLAYTTASGFSPGKWLHRLRVAMGVKLATMTTRSR